MSYKKDPKFLNQIQYCEHNGIPLIVIIGAEEKEKGKVKIRVVAKRDPPDEVLKLNRILLLLLLLLLLLQSLVELKDLVDEVKKRLP